MQSFMNKNCMTLSQYKSKIGKHSRLYARNTSSSLTVHSVETSHFLRRLIIGEASKKSKATNPRIFLSIGTIAGGDEEIDSGDCAIPMTQETHRSTFLQQGDPG